MSRRYTTPATDYAAAALRRGPLVKRSYTWRFGRRRFHNSTITKLIAAGEARRVGNTIIKTEGQNG